MSDGPLLELDDVTMRVRERKLLAHTSWTIRRGEQWAVLGPNGSGKSTLARTVAGELPSAGGRIRLRSGERIALVSFERQQELYLRELELDHARHFSGRTDDVLTARQLLEGAADGDRSGAEHGKRVHNALSGALDLSHLLDRPFRSLSAGEMRKALVARAFASGPTLLVLDEPFDGLDARSRATLVAYLEGIMGEGRHVVIVTHRAEEILPGVTHVLALRDGAVVGKGPREEMLEPARLEELYGAPFRPVERRARRRALTASGNGAPSPDSAAPALDSAETLVELEGVDVRYGELTVIRNFTWRLRRGERWGLFGPNGSGKTTLLNLIVGDNLQAYANDVRLFGRRRGNGESVWEIKRRIGLVTPNLQLGYRHSIRGLEVVLSGFFDSIGLYRQPSEAEIAAARRWIEALDLSDLADRHFTRLSYGQRRLLLIARALVKEPELLVLDEPCQGLDPRNRHRVLDAIDAACDSSPLLSMLYVTHHDDEHPAALTHLLRLHGPGEPATIEPYSP